MSMTLFKKVDYTLSKLLHDIELGEIGLPEIQRPFVWKPVKVRDLFDSMYRGFPVGYFLFWENGIGEGHRGIGSNTKQSAPRLLIVDGQQRLTSLYAVLRSQPIVDKNYKTTTIQIAFNPREERFEVSDAAIKRDPEFIPDISILWSSTVTIFQFIPEFVERLSESRTLSEADKREISGRIGRLYDLQNYQFTALELSRSVEEEQVAQVFVRINSQGVELNQADFILTLMSVFWDEGRHQLEDFCRRSRLPAVQGASPFNHFIKPEPSQMLRVAVALGFRRARLQHVYSILRGKDLETGVFSTVRRDEQFVILKSAQSYALDLKHWHDFFACLRLAGFVGASMVSSNTALLYAYAMYLIGKRDYGVEHKTIRRTIGRWFFFCHLTRRYSSSPETMMESDLARLRRAETADDFVAILDGHIRASLTLDYWEISLPHELESSAGKSPAMSGYLAALNLLGAKVLFSDLEVGDLLDDSITSSKSPLERHHLFPKKYLESKGIVETTTVNQIANFALVEWPDNAHISSQPPAEYLARYRPRFDDATWRQWYVWHALPDGWESMPYLEFLQARRKMIAQVIRAGFESLSQGTSATEISADVEKLIAEGESVRVEFKSTLRVNLHTGNPDDRMERAVLKTIAAFLNSREHGVLVIGVDDSGKPLGVGADGFPDEDAMLLHLVNLISSRIGKEFALHIDPEFESVQGARILVVRCRPAGKPVYVKEGNHEAFYVRLGPSTQELSPSEMLEYVKRRFL